MRSARVDRLVSFTTDAESAAVILADPVRYDGLPLIWAQMFARRRRLKCNAQGVPVDFDAQYKRMTAELGRAGWLSEWRNDGDGVRLYWRKPDTQTWRTTPDAYQAMLDEQVQGYLFRESA